MFCVAAKHHEEEKETIGKFSRICNRLGNGKYSDALIVNMKTTKSLSLLTLPLASLTEQQRRRVISKFRIMIKINELEKKSIMFLLAALTQVFLLLLNIQLGSCQKISQQNFNFPYQQQRRASIPSSQLQQQQQQQHQQRQPHHLVRSNLDRQQRPFQHHQQQEAYGQYQVPADRRASQSSQTDHKNQQQQQHDHSADNNQGKLLVCYYTTRQTAPYWPKGARQFVVSPETLNSLSEMNGFSATTKIPYDTTIGINDNYQLQQNSLARSMSASPMTQHQQQQQQVDNSLLNHIELNRKSQPQVLKMHTDLQRQQQQQQQQQQLLFGPSSAMSSQNLSFNNLFVPTGSTSGPQQQQQQRKLSGQINSSHNLISNSNLNRNKNKQHQDALILQALATEQLNSIVATSTPALVVSSDPSDSFAGGPTGRQSVAYSIIGADVQEEMIKQQPQQQLSIGNGGSGNNGKSAAISSNNGVISLVTDHPVGSTNSPIGKPQQQVVFSTPSLILGRSTFAGGSSAMPTTMSSISVANNELQLDTKSQLFIPHSIGNLQQQQQQQAHNNYNNYNRREAAASASNLPLHQQQKQQVASVSPLAQQQQQQQQQPLQVGVQKGKSLQVVGGSGEQQVSPSTANGLMMSSGGGVIGQQSKGLVMPQLSLIGQDSHLSQQQQRQAHDFQPQYSQNHHHQLLVTQQQQQQQQQHQSLPQVSPTITTLTPEVAATHSQSLASGGASYPTIGNLLTTTPSRAYQQQQQLHNANYQAYPSSSANAALAAASVAVVDLPSAANPALPPPSPPVGRAATVVPGATAGSLLVQQQQQGDKSNQERAYHEHQTATQSSQQQQQQAQVQRDAGSTSPSTMQTYDVAGAATQSAQLASLPAGSTAPSLPGSTTQLLADHHTGSGSAAAAQQAASTLSSALVSSPLSTMFDVFGAASQYLMRFKPTALISPSAFVSLNNMHQGATQDQLRHPSSQLTAQPAGAPASVNSSSFIPLPFTSSFFSSIHKNSAGSLSEDKSSGSSSSPSTSGRGFLARLAGSVGGGQSFQRREEVCGRTIQTPERRIIGGEGARYGEFPYQVHIKIAKHQCGGALVDRQSIVTAAHCVYHFITRAPVSKLQIVIGAYDIEDEQYQELPPQYFKVNKVKLHPNFRFSASHPDRYDIAILKLDKPVKYTDNVLPVCLPSKDLKFESSIGTVTGFGKTDPSLSNRYGTRLLQKVDVPIIENQECERWHRTRGIDLKIFPEMMCAGYEDGLKDACVGDSGGPLVVKTPTGPDGSFRWTLAGITSAGFGCAQSRQPGIYHRVSHTVDWILENLD